MPLSVEAAGAATEPLPNWIKQMVAKRTGNNGGTVIEEARYRGQRTFIIMPEDRPSDSGNEHILYSSKGHIICEFGGLAGHVTVGSCDIEQIKFVRSLGIARH